MKKIQNLNDLFVEQLQDRYDAASQQVLAYKKLLEACTDEGLKAILQKDIEANRKHREKLEDIFSLLGEDPNGEQCEGTAGLICEAHELVSYSGDNPIVNQGIAISIQHINHHDIAGYNSCMLFARALGRTQIQTTLSRMLEDEKNTDAALNSYIASSLMN